MKRITTLHKKSVLHVAQLKRLVIFKLFCLQAWASLLIVHQEEGYIGLGLS